MKATHTPAELVRKTDVWHIKFEQTNPETNQLTRFRRRFNLNKIKDLKSRMIRSSELINEINQQLDYGWPYVDLIQIEKSVSIIVAFQIALNAKKDSTRIRTQEFYHYIAQDFIKYCEEKVITHTLIEDFSNTMAIGFFDWLLKHKNKFSPGTHNTYVVGMRSLFNEMVRRENLKFNYFKNIPIKKGFTKSRRRFYDFEKPIVINAVKQHDATLYLAVLFAYHLFIRPEEMRRLRFKHFNLKHRMVNLPPDITKNKKTGQITIPESLVKYLESIKFNSYPPHYLVFGKGGQPHPNIPIGGKTLTRKHRYVLLKLMREKKLLDIDGLTLYSWKDSGAMHLVENSVNIMDVMKQLRHSDLSTTQIYLQAFDGANDAIRMNDSDIL